MKEKPILFSGAMVRAILDGRKTQTRRVVKPQPTEWCAYPNSVQRLPARESKDHLCEPIPCPYGASGDRLWVRETFSLCESCRAPDDMPAPIYRATSEAENITWKPSIFMPRWASRLTLEITGIRVERLQDISEADAIAEGVVDTKPRQGMGHFTVRDIESTTARGAFRGLWESINGKGSWAVNPWVWAVEFKKL